MKGKKLILISMEDKNVNVQKLFKKVIVLIFIFIICMISFQQYALATLNDDAKMYLENPELLNSATDLSNFMWIIDVEESDLDESQKEAFKKCLNNAKDNSLVKADSTILATVTDKLQKFYGETTQPSTPQLTPEDDNGELNDTIAKYLLQPSIAKSIPPTNIENDIAAITSTSKKALGSKENINKYIEVLDNLSQNTTLQDGLHKDSLLMISNKLDEMLKEDWNLSDSQKKKVEEIKGKVGEMKEISKENQQIAGTYVEDKEKNKNDKIYKQPTIDTSKIRGDGTLQDMVSDADNFVDKGDKATIQADQLKDLSGRIYNILLEIGIGASVIIGLILGIKFMLSGVEEKAEVKKMIWVYVIGCIVTFGSFGIWKLVVEILEQL